MSDREPPVGGPEEPGVVQTVRWGTEDAFGHLIERHRRELQVHCYRMLGSFSESEDMVQETFLRAWRNRESFEGRSTLRAWLYRIATNACLDVIRKRPRRVLPYDVAPATDLAVTCPLPRSWPRSSRTPTFCWSPSHRVAMIQ